MSINADAISRLLTLRRYLGEESARQLATLNNIEPFLNNIKTSLLLRTNNLGTSRHIGSFAT
ncbi:hypothetical protein [Bradyrhizobium sp. ORS 375]|uniref:hypothetical protein n=1 Tax=Bradyrhizobium sp. (strain ORS 375) TaxID=566679 RepID=UPI001585373B|nr:hypothetical protein [Bradyrhizobium sp. ORS 375]